MEIMNIDGTDMSDECKKYLEKLVGSENEGKVDIWGHQNSAQVRDVESFHRIAQSVNNSELRQFGGGLDFILDVPIEGQTLQEHFRVCLDADNTHDFLSKYARQYKIIKI
jgi:hypothetical protein